jgi:hypothetical protein
VSLGSGDAAKAFTDLVDAVLDIAPLVAMEDCSARLFHVLDQTLGPVKSQP